MRSPAFTVEPTFTLPQPSAPKVTLYSDPHKAQAELDVALAEAKKVEQKLANADFVARAKPEVVEENRERLAGFLAEAARLAEALARITTED